MAPKIVALIALAAAVSAMPTVLEPRVEGQSYDSPLPNDWQLYGCAQDGYPDYRVLTGGYKEDRAGMTQEECLSYCDSQNAQFCGIEYGYQCFAGATLDSRAIITASPEQLLSRASDGGCTVAAPGNGAQNAGGESKLLVFQTKTRSPASNPSLAGQTRAGCFVDAEDNRRLPYPASTNPGDMSVENCVSLCNTAGYDLSGLQYSYQCWCGRSGETDLSQPVDEQNCQSVCSGNSSEFCGGPSHNSIYVKQA